MYKQEDTKLWRPRVGLPVGMDHHTPSKVGLGGGFPS